MKQMLVHEIRLVHNRKNIPKHQTGIAVQLSERMPSVGTNGTQLRVPETTSTVWDIFFNKFSSQGQDSWAPKLKITDKVVYKPNWKK